MLTITLTQNRRDVQRYVSMVIYRRSGDVVTPYLAREGTGGDVSVERIPWNEIRGSEADPEFAADWAEHVRYQAELRREA